MYSLRRALAVRFSLTMLTALSLIALWAVVSVQRTLRSQTDRALSATLAVLMDRLAAGGSIPAPQPDGTNFVRYVQEGSRLVALRDGRGRVLQTNVPDESTLELDTAAFTSALNGRTEWATGAWSGLRVRSVYARAPRGSPPRAAVLQVAGSLAPLAEANRDLLFAVLGIVLLGTLAVAIGAFWLARSAVNPVLQIVNQADRIVPEVPARITAHADVSEYASLIEVLNRLLERSERALSGQRRLVADVGHELKTPLTALQGEIEIALRSQRTPERYQQTLRSGLEEIQRMTVMCDELLLITRADSRILLLHRVPLDPNDLLRERAEAQLPTVTEKGLTLSTRFDYAGKPVVVDAELITRVVDELIDNAVKFTPPGGAIEIGTKSADGNARLWVEDSGPGLPEDQLAHLFEPFYRADSARTRDEGTGLGLAMAASVTRAHGGSIRASNILEHGARFEVDLPV